MMWITRSLKFLVALVLVFVASVFFVKYYSWIFAKTVKGRILDVQRVTQPTAIFNSRITDAQIHSYSVLIQGDDGKLYTASSEDRQWQVATRGYCCTAVFYRYPFWNIEKGGTFFNARLKELSLCPGETEPPPPIAPSHSTDPGQAPTQDLLPEPNQGRDQQSP